MIPMRQMAWTRRVDPQIKNAEATVGSLGVASFYRFNCSQALLVVGILKSSCDPETTLSSIV